MILPKIIKWIDLYTLEKECIKECNFDTQHRNILIQELINNKYIICGDTHQNLAIPVFNDGSLIISMRTWSEIMKDAYMKIDPYSYIENNVNDNTFYMASSCNVKEKIPDASDLS